MDGEIMKTRIRAVRRRLEEKKVKSLLLTKRANVTYMTGFSGDDTWALVAPRAIYLITDSRYTEQAQNECLGCKIIERSKMMVEASAKLIKKLRLTKGLALEKSASVCVFEALKKHLNIRLKAVADIIESTRSCKDSGETAAIKTASRIGAESLRRALRYAKPGVTENELAGRVDFAIRRAGATNSFETIVAFGASASRPHHQPGSKKLKKNDTILIDFGVRYKNYCCDLTRCFGVGSVSGFYRKVYGAVREAQEAAIKLIRAGIEIKRVDAAARDVIKRYDLPVYGHGTGHGLGLEIHEEPFLKAENTGKLQAGQVITIEPGVYMPGKLGVRIEDDVLVTEAGSKVLSRDDDDAAEVVIL